MGAKGFCNDRPPHEFGDGEELEEAGFSWDKVVTIIGVDAMKEVRLFIVMGRKENVVDGSLEDLSLE